MSPKPDLTRPSPQATWLGVAMAAAILAASPAAVRADPDAPVPRVADRSPEIRLPDEVTTLPLVMVREFPFVDASIEGVQGKLMLDTGYQGALTINDHRVQLSGGRKIGTGFFGSGQTFDVRLMPEVRDVRFGGLSYDRVTQVTTQDARMLERITPDFLGWLGYHAFENHALKLDYQAVQATFYLYGEADYLEGERVVAALAFETRTLPNYPIMEGRIGDLDLVVTWDTGQQGGLHVTEEAKARLLTTGRLRPSEADPESLDLSGLVIDGHALPTIRGISVETGENPSARSLGIAGSDEVTLGYGLLHQFKTVWDFEQKRIYLLQR